MNTDADAACLREALSRIPGTQMGDGGSVFRDRYQLPRPQWVWDRVQNSELEALAALSVFLTSESGNFEAVRQWLDQYRMECAGVHIAGGAAIHWVRGQSDARLRFVSGGQDALESLEHISAEFHELLREPPEFAVLWLEEPLRRS